MIFDLLEFNFVVNYKTVKYYNGFVGDIILMRQSIHNISWGSGYFRTPCVPMCILVIDMISMEVLTRIRCSKFVNWNFIFMLLHEY